MKLLGISAAFVAALALTAVAFAQPQGAAPGTTVSTTTTGTTTIAAAREPAGLPSGWSLVSAGPNGGTVWQGQIPNEFATWDTRASAIYFPPGYTPSKRYPVVYLLHGMRGSPIGFWDGLDLAQVADGLIASGAAKPFLAVMPVAGPLLHPDLGEWAGTWEDFVVQDVVPWVDSHLSTVRSPSGRALEGLCAGGFGAMDIGIRHAGTFGTLGAWEGYFAPVFHDGPFVHASKAYVQAHDPMLLLKQEASVLKRDGTRFFVSVGGNHGHVLARYSLSFAQELKTLGLPYELWRPPPANVRKGFLRATMPSALLFATDAFAAARR